jgi:heptosyltransferase-2
MLTDGKEEHLARELQEETSPVIPVASGLPLRKVMALLDRVTLFIGNDSGLLHIAVALGRKTIGLFGPTSAWEWHPYEEARGHAAIQKDVECRGAWCGKQRCDDLACLKKITASEVIAKAREMLANA